MCNPRQGCPLSCLGSFPVSILLRGNRLRYPASLLSGGSVAASSNISILSAGVSSSSKVNPIGMFSSTRSISVSTSNTSLSDIVSIAKLSFKRSFSCLVAGPDFELLLSVSAMATAQISLNAHVLCTKALWRCQEWWGLIAHEKRKNKQSNTLYCIM